MVTRKAASPNTPSDSQVWLVRAGRHGEDESTALENGLAILGFTAIPDLSGAMTPEDILRRVREALPGEKENRIRNLAAQLSGFILAMRDGDIVALPLKTTGQIALGQAAGPYQFRPIGFGLISPDLISSRICCIRWELF